ncbi:type II secretion system F family protein [Paenibacillus cremeus]|uniref:Type II secretion system F family protein n=1 Tax=Paenibacillus cremeus TaxID=2163881 RepID=A0A559KE52_9BACL|nr:type II secretion system F family protein [Paenibacillus cremeus]TVY10410.1 type II secretion system F family protein [Paenibacillus cremeus]
MANFTYEAVSDSGKKLKGVLRAPNKNAAISELRGKGYIIRSMQEKKATAMDKEISIGRAVKLEDFVIFCRQFATLIRSGIQIDQALTILEDQTATKNLKAALGDVAEQVRTGHSLSKAMSEHRRIFPEMFVNMIASGETGGNLDDVLDRMADHYEKEHKTVQKVKSAMTYPIIVMIIAVFVVIFLLIKIVPTFADMFMDQGAELPWITKFVMSSSDAIVEYWWMFLAGIAALIFAYRAFTASDEGKFVVDAVKFRIPIFGIILKKAAIARLTRTMSSLFMSAVPVLQALDVTEKVVGNRVMAKVLREAKDSLQMGKLLSDPFSKSELFPRMVVQMLIVGEETGQVDKMLMKIAEFYESDVDQSVDRLKAVIEPLMLLIVSSLVGIIVAAIMSPMFKMYDNFLK